VASPRTEAIQDEVAKRLMIDRGEFIEKADAGEMRIVLEGYLTERIAYPLLPSTIEIHQE
jgi:hypothetical protein